MKIFEHTCHRQIGNFYITRHSLRDGECKYVLYSSYFPWESLSMLLQSISSRPDKYFNEIFLCLEQLELLMKDME